MLQKSQNQMHQNKLTLWKLLIPCLKKYHQSKLDHVETLFLPIKIRKSLIRQ